MNILFVCSRNQWRSRTAEAIFKGHAMHQVKSAGTANSARIKVTEKLLQWAELIFVMEKHHREKLKQKFGPAIQDKRIIVLDIEDHYGYMDMELIESIKTSVKPYL